MCWLGTRSFSAKTAQGAAQLDPRQLYGQEHASTIVIRREYGTAVKEVKAITLHEALNATHTLQTSCRYVVFQNVLPSPWVLLWVDVGP